MALLVSVGAWADEPTISAGAAEQMSALAAIKSSKTSDQRKIDSRLYLAMLKERGDARLNVLTDFRFVQPEADGRVSVDLPLASVNGLKSVVALIESLGGVVDYKSATFMTLRARVKLGDLEALAALPDVRWVHAADTAMTSVVNVSEGDVTHAAAAARGFFGVDGSGVKIGVLSDGVAALAALQASGDLPAVQVLPGQAGSGNEGAAMLEIIHDLAPNAQLAFATAFTSHASFAQNILDLRAAGCDIIVDDIIYFAEPVYGDGTVAQSVNTVTADGALYFSSAGNEGNKADTTSGNWEGDFLATTLPTPPALTGTGTLHDFGDGGLSILVTATSQGPVVLHWAEHFNLAGGLASTDFDLYILNGTLTTIFDASTTVQDGNDRAFEQTGQTFTNERIVITRFAAGTTSSVPMMMLKAFRGRINPALSTPGATYGHSAAAAAFSVAATPAAGAFGPPPNPVGPYPAEHSAANLSELFSSDGPRRIILDPAGAEITPGNRTSTGGVVRQKPDITAADGVACAAPGFDPFFGTSAAAPHAGAIAGLLWSAVPTLTPAEIRTALITTAIDIEVAGVDNVTGAGIVMADDALDYVGATPVVNLAEGAGTLEAENCAPPNNVLDPGETVTVSLCVTNNGGIATTNLVGTLNAGGGVANPTAPQVYGAIAPAATVCHDFTFDVAALCGDLVEAELALQDGATSYGPFTYDFQTGVLTTTPSFTQNFDGVTAPALPAGWTTANAGSGIPWVTSATNPDTAPNAAFEPNATTAGEASLTSPSIPINTAAAQLTFRHTYNTEIDYDGGVLEIAIGAGPFQDILTAGGSFLAGGYDSTLQNFGPCSPNFNPLGGRPAWNGSSAYKTTTAQLPAAAAGQNVQLRWRFGTDCSVAPGGAPGWRVDTISLIDGFVCCSVPLALTPTSLSVDDGTAPGTTGNGNGVWEPGEIVLIKTGWYMLGNGPYDITGTASNLTGPPGAAYNLADAAADFGTVNPGDVTDCAGADCYQVGVDDPASRPGSPWTATVQETVNAIPAFTNGGGFNKTWSLHIGDSFTDAPPGSFAYKFIETLFKNGVTSGCGAGIFCPGTNVPREQMAVFLLVSEEGSSYVPPPCTVPMFTDVPCSNPFSKWINELANPLRAITSGCGGGNYCPADPVTREQMAVFLLRTEGGASYTPPDCVTQQFDDVPCSSGFSKWINELANRGITSGCNVTPPLFCPATPVTRAQMSVFLTATFGLVLYGP